jgi:hypothetical protein
VVEVFIPSLLTKDHQDTGSSIQNNGNSTRPPDEWISNKVDLSVIMNPEVLEETKMGVNEGLDDYMI